MLHADLVKIAARWLRNTKRCGVVLTEHHGGTLEHPDAIGFIGGMWSIQVECKVSLSDFRADAKKNGRRFDATTGEYRQAAERYYLTPVGLVSANALPLGWGLLEFDGKRVNVKKPAEKLPKNESVWRNEVTRLYMELRRYQAQGIRYLTIREQQAKLLTPARPDGEGGETR